MDRRLDLPLIVMKAPPMWTLVLGAVLITGTLTFAGMTMATPTHDSTQGSCSIPL